MFRFATIIGLLGYCWLTACGDPLVGDSFRGKPLVSFEGQVAAFSGDTSGGQPLRVSLFWSASGNTKVSIDELHEQASASVHVQFPSTFHINVFYPPETANLVPPDRRYGLALILVYEDVDGNGSFTADRKELRGGAEDRALLYAPEPLSKEDSPTGLEMPQGFSLVSIPLQCSSSMPIDPPQGFDCGVDLGKRCDNDSDCTAQGVCLQRLDRFEFYQGACSVSYAVDGCKPEGGNLVTLNDSIWLKRCFPGAERPCARDSYSCVDMTSKDASPCWGCWPAGTQPASDHGPAICQPEGTMEAPDCDLKIGDSCGQNMDCLDDVDAGRCLLRLGDTLFPDGWCTLENPWPSCIPKDAVSFQQPVRYWLKACDADAQCRLDDGYRCNPMFHACLPESPVQLRIFSGFKIEENLNSLCTQ